MAVADQTLRSSVELHAPTVLLGRDAELRALDELLDRGDARGGALVIRGQAGTGKSALLLEAARRASRRGMMVLTVAGSESDARMPFAGLDQLLNRFAGEIDRLPGPKRHALIGALGMAEVDPRELFVVALATLELLGDAAARRPILLIADNADWLDRRTQDVLAFVARRFASDPITLLAAIREGSNGGLETAGLPELRLGPLGAGAAAALLDAQAAGLAPAVRERLLREAAGNPLALVELPIAFGRSTEEALLPAWLPLTTRLRHAFVARVRSLPTNTRTLLLVAALNDGAAIHEAVKAGTILTGTELTVEELTPAASAGLVELDIWGLRFCHPLMRSAIAQAASASQRRVAHAALADVLTAEPSRRLRHRAASIAGTDEGVAAELEAAASQTPGIAASVEALERASQLSDDPVRSRARLLRAAEFAFELGRPDVARRLMRQLQPLGLEALERARIAWLDTLLVHGHAPGAAPLGPLAESVEQFRLGGATDRAMSSLLTAAVLGWSTKRDPEACDQIVAAAERMPVAPDDPRLLAILAFGAPLRRGPDVLERVSQMTPRMVGDPVASLHVALAVQRLGGVQQAASFFDAAVAGLRSDGRLLRLAEALEAQARNGIWLGTWDLAEAAAEEAARLARETGSHLIAAGAQNVQAWLAALRGDRNALDGLTDETELTHLPSGPVPLAVAQLARGLAALGEGSYAAAYEQLRRIFDPADVAYDASVREWIVADLVEAAAECGRSHEATEIVAELEAVAEQTRSPLLLAGLANARPLLADDDLAEDLFKAALDVGHAWPFLRARNLLAYGTWLRLRRRGAESRTPLRIARQAFDALGAKPWSERARKELRASGETTRERSPDARARLSAQELQIAQMAAEGLTNREIGQELFLSHRTVSSYLYRVFPKLGITSRSELGDALASIVATPKA